MTLVLSTIQTVAAAYVLWYALCAINAMSRRTHHAVRAGVVLIAIGAFFEVAQILWAHVPDVPEILILIGMAIGTHYNKRANRCPCVVIDRTNDCPVRKPGATA